LITRTLARRSGPVVEVVLIALLAVSCGSTAPAATPNPTPTRLSTPTPTVVPPEENMPTGPDQVVFLEAAAPQELSRAILPVNSSRISSQFRGLQWNLANRHRTPELDRFVPGEVSVAYGTTQPVACGTVGLSARNVSTGDTYPRGWTAERVIADYASGGDWEVEDFGRDGRLLWVNRTTTCSSADSPETDTLFTISWGNEGTAWVFSALAGNPQERDELVAVFVAAFR
jgi:hypothetical protein